MPTCPVCKRQMNEGNSRNPGECDGREQDEEEWLCDAYAEIHNLKEAVERLTEEGLDQLEAMSDTQLDRLTLIKGEDPAEVADRLRKSFEKMLEIEVLNSKNLRLTEALKRIDFYATQVLSSSGLTDPKHTMMKTAEMIHNVVTGALK